MMPHEQHELIKRYILDIADQHERDEVESLVSTDPAFAAELEFQTQLLHTLKQGPAMDDLRDQLNQIHQQQKARKAHYSIRRIFPMLAVAAALALLIVAGWWFLLREDASVTSSSDLYAAYFSPPEELIPGLTTREFKDQDFNQELHFWHSAEAAYSQANYGAVLLYLDSLNSLDPPVNREKLAWYRGITLLCNDQPEEALAWFDQVVNIYPEERTWYKAMANLRLAKLNETRQLLQQIVDESHGRKKRAKELFEILKRKNE